MIAPENRRAVAIAWYTREDYDEIKLLMDDGDVLPDDYDVWRRRVEAILRIEQARGSVVLKAMIYPRPFLAWCNATGQAPDVHARTRHVNLAIEDYCAGYASAAFVDTTSEPA
jgi:hypothetical protein